MLSVRKIYVALILVTFTFILLCLQLIYLIDLDSSRNVL